MRILITGASGQLGAYLIENLLNTEYEIVAWSHGQTGRRFGVPLNPIDLADGLAIDLALDSTQPDVIIHAAAISSAEVVRSDPSRARKINIEATERIAGWAGRNGRGLVFTSTDLVFDGTRPWNREIDPASPIQEYGRTKLEAESAVLAIPRGIVARLSLLYGPTKCGRAYFFDKAIEAVRLGEPRTFFTDEYRTPLDLATASLALIELSRSHLAGIYHVGGAERLSRFELMRRSCLALGLDSRLVRPGVRAEADLPEPRPEDVSLETTKLALAFPGFSRPSIEAAVEPFAG